MQYGVQPVYRINCLYPGLFEIGSGFQADTSSLRRNINNLCCTGKTRYFRRLHELYAVWNQAENIVLVLMIKGDMLKYSDILNGANGLRVIERTLI